MKTLASLVAWSPDGKRVTKTHATLDGKTMLCGVSAGNGWGHVENKQHGGSNMCPRCRAALEKRGVGLVGRDKGIAWYVVAVARALQDGQMMLKIESSPFAHYIMTRRSPAPITPTFFQREDAVAVLADATKLIEFMENNRVDLDTAVQAAAQE